MKKVKKFSSKPSGMLAGILMGAGVSLAVCVLGAAVLAWLIVFEKVGEGAISWGTMVILPLASCAGSSAAWSRVKQNRLAVLGAHAGAFYCLLLLGALPFGGKLEGLGITAVMILLGGVITFIPGILGHKSGGRKYKMKAIR